MRPNAMMAKKRRCTEAPPIGFKRARQYTKNLFSIQYGKEDTEPGCKSLTLALSSGAEDGEHSRKAGLLAPDSSRFPRRLPTTGWWQWLRLLEGQQGA